MKHVEDLLRLKNQKIYEFQEEMDFPFNYKVKFFDEKGMPIHRIQIHEKHETDLFRKNLKKELAVLDLYSFEPEKTVVSLEDLFEQEPRPPKLSWVSFFTWEAVNLNYCKEISVITGPFHSWLSFSSNRGYNVNWKFTNSITVHQVHEKIRFLQCICR